MTQTDYNEQCRTRLELFISKFTSQTVQSTFEIWNHFKEKYKISRAFTTWPIGDEEYQCYFKYESLDGI